MSNELNVELFRQTVEYWAGDLPDADIDDEAAAALLLELGTAGMSVIPTSYLLELQHRAAAHATGEAGEAVTNRLADLLVDYYSNEYEYCTDDEAKVRAFPVAEAILAALTSAPAQAPQPAAPRCGGGGVEPPCCEEGYHRSRTVRVLLDNGESILACYKYPNPDLGIKQEGAWLRDFPLFTRITSKVVAWVELAEDDKRLFGWPKTPTPPTCPRTCRTCPAAGDAGETE